MSEATALELTIDQMMRPERWFWVLGSISEFDAAEYLYFNHTDQLTSKQFARAEAILLRSGKYQITSTPDE